MSVELPPISWRASEVRRRQLAILQEKFAPWTRKRSQVLDLAVDVLYTIVATTGTLAAVVEWLQGLLSTTLCARELAPRVDFPADPQAAPETAGPQLVTERRGPVASRQRVNQRSADPVVPGTVAWCSFLPSGERSIA